jgi:hypothetical protein
MYISDFFCFKIVVQNYFEKPILPKLMQKR